MNSSVVREKFFQYFKDKGHEIIPSASVINKTDKNLMFTNAGMNQFRNIFTGDQDTKFSRVANSQKCLRVSGKHNDLEEVGVDTYHHTFFEMLGNWSFGDYFKKEIIEWSFDLITNVYGLEREDLYVSVFEGSEDDNTEFDKETFDEWKKYFSQDKIINGNKKDNFWEMGDTGPCGPCSEIHIDLRSTAEKKKIKGADLVNKDHPQVVEIWNLVFIQYDRKKDGSLKKLDKQYVDTGMGLERLCMALQGKKSTYETDFFTDTIKEIENISSKKYLGGDESIDIGIRVISDHLRAIIFTILDGQVPGNTGSGYVIRRILRRAIRYGYTNLDIHEPFLFKLVEKVTDKYDDIYPSLRNQQNYVESIIKDEEKGFLKTLNQGLSLINELINTNPTDKIIKGDIAFKLYDTYGFPIDLTSLIATENNFKVDLDGFNENMKIQKNRSKSIKNEEVSDWIIINDNLSSSIFIGYDMDEIDGKIIKYRECKTDQDKVSYHIVTDKTSFYPEGGGQIGDIGQIILGDKKIKVNNTFRDAGEIIHVTIELPNDLNSLIKLKIDRNRRTLIESNHTSTHLLHQALRKILGDHVEQRGSMISDKMFRFDFSHQNKISDSELSNVNNFVNEKINESIDLIEDREEDYQIATKNGAIGLFTEKYEDKVRTIKFNDSYELCGGTHVKNTSDISSFKIISEGSQAFGIRRIVATSNEEVIIAEGLKQRAVKEKTANENANKLLKKEIESQNKIKIQLIKDDIIKNINNTNDANTFVGEVDLDPKSIKELCFILSDKFENLFLILLSKSDEKVFISCFISKELIEEKELNASKIIKELSPLINGSGGGQSFYATGGGTNINGIDSVIKESKKIISQI
ncbi:MAG: alanine--tRNA ligase [Cryomorphaceae bacterium]|jgi:alanyl-tRNA synthetase|nr:alanine--tRNA ligase [Cryomorphaceae bacterium]MBT6546984.1 alanine--tRNA ligase [Cryomorphaceae bacterium]MBT7019356.1 alanine--tRNA ligase [Cryomorphaceae bacterium]MBT7383225.1 alanine--tRNA ligase [Cryomorphaceae bacterium]MBT7546517.1 alanine--tRNA ligase [Cryomorphaceae bacterium]